MCEEISQKIKTYKEQLNTLPEGRKIANNKDSLLNV